MKKWVIALSLLGALAAPSFATISTGPVPPTNCNPVTVSTSTPTEMTGNTTNIQTSAAITFVMVINLDTAATLYCNQRANVSSSGANMGVPILAQATATSPFNFFGWAIGQTEPWYCLSTGASATKAMVCTNQ